MMVFHPINEGLAGKFLSTALLSTTLLLGIITNSAEARRGSRGSGATSWGKEEGAEIFSTFSTFDSTRKRDEIESCSFGKDECLFQGVVSDLEISQITLLIEDVSIEKLEIGTTNLNLYSQALPSASLSSNSLSSFLPVRLSDRLSLKSIWDGTETIYKVTDSEGEFVNVKGFTSDDNGNISKVFSKPLGFALSSPSRPEDNFINSIGTIVKAQRGELDLPQGYAFVNSKGEAISFTKVDEIEVPEQTSHLSLFALTLFLGISYIRKKQAN